MNAGQIIAKLRQAILLGDEKDAPLMAQEVLAAGIDPMVALEKAIMEPMQKLGQQFQDGEVYLPELMLVGDAAKLATEVLIPMERGKETGKGTIVIGTIQGDLHDIGKNVVAAVCAAHGFRVTDLGTNVSPRNFINAAEKESADIIAISTLITTTLPYHRQVVQLLKDSGKRNQVFVIVGGGPVSPAWAEEVGADGYGRDAQNASDLCKSLLEGVQKPPLDTPLTIGALRKNN